MFDICVLRSRRLRLDRERRRIHTDAERPEEHEDKKDSSLVKHLIRERVRYNKNNNCLKKKALKSFECCELEAHFV